MSAVALHIIKAMTFQVAKMTIYPLSFNKTNCDHLIYKPQDTHKVFKNIKLKTFNTEILVKFQSLCPPDVATLSGHDWVASRVQTILQEWQTCILERGIIYPF